MTPENKPSLNHENFLALARARASFCTFVNIHFTHLPNEPFVQFLRKNHFFDALAELKQSEEVPLEIAKGAEFMLSFLNSTKDLVPKEMAKSLGLDRTQLYRGISPNIGPSPPYETLWTDNRVDCRDLLKKISRVYHNFGYTPAINTHERLDYIGIELDYFGHLIQKEVLHREALDVEAARNIMTLQDVFLRDHLNRWAPEFIRKALTFVRTDFYRGHLHMLNGFIEEEKEVLKQLVKG
jgi:TorA maturation chaperone TorD